jgi:outer membrane immunogenic protein
MTELTMHKLFHASAALTALLAASVTANAADLRVKAPPKPPAPPPFSWTGFYVGGNFGGAWPRRDATDTLFGLNFDNSNNSGVFIGGGQAGFNYQIDSFVLGIEGDFDWSGNSSASNGVFIPALGSIQVTGNNRWITIAAARFGVALNNVLFYGKAGGGWAGNGGFTVTNLTTGASFTGSNSFTESGWLLGAGFEWAFADNWSARFEYNYLGLSSRTFTVPLGAPFLAGDTFTSNRNVQMATIGVNYRFNWAGQIAAKY